MLEKDQVGTSAQGLEVLEGTSNRSQVLMSGESTKGNLEV